MAMTIDKAINRLENYYDTFCGYNDDGLCGAIYTAISTMRKYQKIEEILKEPTTKNDLEVDWESYKDVDGNSLDDLILEVLQNNFDCGNTYGYKVADEIIGLLPTVTPQKPKTGYLSIDDVMSVFDDFMCSEVDEEGTETFLEMLKDKSESEG